MKKIIALASLMVLSVTLGACNPRNDIEENKMPEDNSPTESNIPPKTGNELDDGTIDETVNTVMTDEEMIDSSDYIAKVKMIQREGKDSFKLEVLENLKGDLSVTGIPDSDKLQQNREYLVFLKEVDGRIEKTNGNDSYVLLEGDNQVLFDKINKKR